MTLGEISALVALVLNLLGLVWGAAKMSSAVEQLQTSSQDLKKLYEHCDGDLRRHETRISIIEHESGIVSMNRRATDLKPDRVD